MTHITGDDRSQMLLLPGAVDDYVGAENPVRFIDAFVDGLDLAAAGFARTAPSATGRPGYAPADLLKLCIYGYLNRLDQGDAGESTAGGSRIKHLAEKIAAISERRARCQDMLAQLDRSGESQISLTDHPDSRAMAAHTRVAVGYNAQIAVDARLA